MYMERIQIEAAVVKKVKPIGLKLAVGSLFLLFAALVMAPWTLFLLLWFVAAAAGGLTLRAVRVVYEALLYAGECVVGR